MSAEERARIADVFDHAEAEREVDETRFAPHRFLGIGIDFMTVLPQRLMVVRARLDRDGLRGKIADVIEKAARGTTDVRDHLAAHRLRPENREVLQLQDIVGGKEARRVGGFVQERPIVGRNIEILGLAKRLGQPLNAAALTAADSRLRRGQAPECAITHRPAMHDMPRLAAANFT